MAAVLPGNSSPSEYRGVDFRRIFEGTHTPQAVLTPDLRVVAINDLFLRVVGKGRGEVLGCEFLQLFPDGSGDATGELRASFRRVLETREPDTLPIDCYALSDSSAPEGVKQCYWSVVNRPVLDDRGNVLYIIHRSEDVTALVRTRESTAHEGSSAILRDHTEQLQTEIFLRSQELQTALRQLRQCEERLLLAVEGADLAVWTWEPATNHIPYQRNLNRLFGLPEPPHTWSELRRSIAPADLEAADAALEHALSGGGDYLAEYRVLWPDGTLHWLTAKGRIENDNGTRLMAGIHLDITARKETEAALFEAREYFRLIVDGALDHAILRVDTTGCIQSWNLGAERIFGYAPGDIVGRPLAALFTPEDCAAGRPAYELEQAIADDHYAEARWQVRVDGSRFWASGTVSSLRDGAGALRGFVKILSDDTERKLAEEQTAYLAHHDPLTGLANRAYFSIRLHEVLAQAKREGRPAALMLLDLDRFKEVNDTRGHHVGDALLKEVGARLLASVRETDVVARLGGDEFVILQANASNVEGTAVLAAKVIDAVSRPVQLGNDTIRTGTSIGVALFPADGDDGAELLKNADLAMYRAKAGGRGKHEFYSRSLGEAPSGGRSRAAMLQDTIEKQELELFYQPQIDLRTWQLAGVEALLRWTNPAWRALRVSDVLALAEETGLIVPLGEWVLHAACAQKKAWAEAGLPPFRVGVNFSPRQLEQVELTAVIERALRAAPTDAPSLELEINARLLADRGGHAASVLTALKKIGVRLAIDEAGVAPGGVGQLQQLPIDTLKIDRSLVRHLPHSRGDMAVVSSVVSIARSLKLQIVAAGVETAEHLAAVKSLGCTAAQGYLFSPPLPAHELEAMLRQGQWSRMNPA